MALIYKFEVFMSLGEENKTNSVCSNVDFIKGKSVLDFKGSQNKEKNFYLSCFTIQFVLQNEINKFKCT